MSNLRGARQREKSRPSEPSTCMWGSRQSVRGLLNKASIQKPVTVQLTDGVATVQVHIIAQYGCKIMSVCAQVQENVKQTIQNMTGITVSRVDVIAAGLAEPQDAEV